MGLGSKVSTCESPPFKKRKMTCLALAGKAVGLGARGSETLSIVAPWSIELPNRLASPTIPKPLPILRKASRRVRVGITVACLIDYYFLLLIVRIWIKSDA
jgi:hypothetical protein